MIDCSWIGINCSQPAGKFAYFRLDAVLPMDTVLTAEITAAAHYRLWVNGHPVCSGPCAGDQHVWYVDTVDLTSYLKEGKNAFAIQVLCLDPTEAIDQSDLNASLFRIIVPDHRHRFAFSAKAGNVDLSTGKADWRVWVDEGISLHTDPLIQFLGDYTEKVDYHVSPAHWKTQDCSAWPSAVCLESVDPDAFHAAVGLVKRYPLQPRPIPMRFRTKDAFMGEIKTETGILEVGSVTIPAGSTFETVLDAGQVKVTEPVFRVEGGSNASLEITYFEKFVKDGEILPRSDWKHGEIKGIKDSAVLNGDAICFEPFYVRTFRFVRLRLTTADQPAVLYAPSFCRTGYPLVRSSNVHSSMSWVDQLWKICVETLQNCMLDTYMDCPYYEQLQFIMDTRLEALFHYTVSQDTQLARKALEDYHRSILPCGLLPGKYPSAYLQVISTFSFHYIFMIWEYYWQTGDQGILKRYRADCDRILSYFEDHLSDRKIMKDPGYWPFVDWHPAWGKTAGTPEALKHGESTILSLMYAYTLEIAAKINTYCGRKEIAEEYRALKDEICQAVQIFCWDDNRGMYREGPAFNQFTQHAQAWAVLCDIGNADCMLKAISDDDVLKISFSTAYEWFRALEKTGLYTHAREELQPWIHLMDLDCKTCPETPGEPRSENHAWSALPMLEFIRGIAGIQAEEPGWRAVSITPRMLDLPDLSVVAATPLGKIAFSFASDGYEVALPEGMTGSFHHPDGSVVPLHSGKQVIQ